MNERMFRPSEMLPFSALVWQEGMKNSAKCLSESKGMSSNTSEISQDQSSHIQKTWDIFQDITRRIIGISLSSKNKCARNTNYTITLGHQAWRNGAGLGARDLAEEPTGAAGPVEEVGVPRNIVPALPSFGFSPHTIRLSSPGNYWNEHHPCKAPFCYNPVKGYAGMLSESQQGQADFWSPPPLSSLSLPS